FSRDWSSDVCSSDLQILLTQGIDGIREVALVMIAQETFDVFHFCLAEVFHDGMMAWIGGINDDECISIGLLGLLREEPCKELSRSEERRVGRVCRDR